MVGIWLMTGLLMTAGPDTGSRPRAGVGPEATVSTRDVRSCWVLDDESVLVASAGGITRVQGVRPGPVVAAGQSAWVVREAGGRVWAGTERGLVELALEPELHVVRRYPSPPVRDIVEHGDAIVVGTWGGGLMRLQDGRLVALARTALPDPAMRVTSLFSDGTELVAGTAGAGLLRVRDGEVQRWDTAVDPMVWALGRGPDGLVVGTLRGHFVQRDGRFERASYDDVRAIAGDGLGIAYGSFGRGLVGTATDAERRYVATLARSGRTLCAGGPTGLSLYRPGRGWRAIASHGPPSNDVSAIAHDGRNLWVGTFDQGLAVMADGRWRTIEGVDTKVNGLAVERRRSGSVVWAATARGLVRVQGRTARTFGRADGLESTDVHTVVALRRGGVAAGTSKGLVMVRSDAARGTVVEPIWTKQGLYARGVWAIAEGADRTLWLGTTRGVFRGRQRRSGRWVFSRLAIASGHLTDDWVTALSLDGDGRVWAGTYSGGVTRLTRDGDAPRGWRAEQLGGGWINVAGLRSDATGTWAATMDGLLRWNEAESRWLTVGRAAPGRDVTGIASSGGRWWVSSRRGLATWTTAPK